MTALVKTITTIVLLVFQYDNWMPGSELSSVDSVSFVGLVLARKGSMGIPHKNMADLNGHPLIHWVLEEMTQSQIFSSIWVSTNDPEVKEYILKNKSGIHVHDRAWYTATDEASSLIAVQEFLSFHSVIETIGLVQATSPFLQRSYLQEATALMKMYNLDSLFSVTRQWKLRWSAVSENEMKSGHWSKPLNFDHKKRPRRQDWSGELVENGMFYFARRQVVLDGMLQGQRSYYIEIPMKHSLEIDTMDDLINANILMKGTTRCQSNQIEVRENKTDISTAANDSQVQVMSK